MHGLANSAHAPLKPSGMAGRLRVLSVFGTRPEAIKMAPVIHALESHPAIQSTVCVTGQHRELLDCALAGFRLTPSYDLDLMQPGQEPISTTSRILNGVYDVVRKTEPDVVLVQGDTTSALGGALAAAYAAVPVAHVEAGLRTGDRRSPFPEELNRQLVDRTADFCFAPTALAEQNLLAEGIPAQRIAVTGNTAIDALLSSCAGLDVPPAADEPVLLVTCHRRENFGAPLQRICEAVRELLRTDPALRVHWVLHPNPEAGRIASRLLVGEERLAWLPPLSYPDLVREMIGARLILTDSGGIQEEAPALGRGVLVLREQTERPEGIDAGVARLVGTRTQSIVHHTRQLLDDPAAFAELSRPLFLYGDGMAAERIAGWLAALAGLGEPPERFESACAAPPVRPVEHASVRP